MENILAVLAENAELKQRIEALEKENTHLKSLSEGSPERIVDTVQAQSGLSIQPPQAPAFGKRNSPEEKIKIFMSLFRGRHDVYAKRWESRKKGTSGYSPVCAYEWKRGICQKPKIKCSSCTKKKYLPINQEVISSHLMGESVLGIYPLLKDETCCFVVIDFDKNRWREDVTAFRESCRALDVFCALERSRSGNGGHIWFFFEQPIKASMARRFASVLLTKAIERQYKLGFDSYDRLLPNQDTLPQGGLGSLIALPLQKNARKEGNSEFVDENFVSYNDQWAFLAGVKKFTTEEISSIIEKHGDYQELGALRQDEDCEPWRTYPAQYHDLSPLSNISLIIANQVYIPAKGLSGKTINAILRLAAFKNPDFYKAQAMRLSVYGKPRILHLGEVFERHIALPRGCLEDVHAFFEDRSVKVAIRDETNPGKSIDVEFNGTLTPLQQNAGVAMLAHRNGVLSAATAFGKTVLAAWLIASRKVNTLILVHRRQLLDQWKKRLTQFLSINEPLPEQPKGKRQPQIAIGEICGGKFKNYGVIDIAIIQSLYDGDEAASCLKNYGMVIVDECHHLPALSFEKVIKASNARYVYGLTATPIRQDGHQPIIFMHCGPIRFKTDSKAQSAERPFAQIVQPEFTTFKMPPRTDGGRYQIQEIYTALTLHEPRNYKIVKDVKRAVDEGKFPIVLADRKDHVDLLSSRLREQGLSVVSMTGGLGAGKRKAIEEELGLSQVIVATGKYVGEGFDCAKLDALFLVSPVAWKGTVQQYVGRLHRLYDDKTEVRAIDYVDIHEPVLERMYAKRLKAYIDAGYSVGTTGDGGTTETGILYSQADYEPVYLRDISEAFDSVLVVCPSITLRRVAAFIKKLAPSGRRRTDINIITRPPSEYDEKTRELVKEAFSLLAESGVKVISRNGLTQKYTVIDKSIVWYGSISFLGYIGGDEIVMRLQNRELAEELTE
ncbi:MAG: DEAD/DEAH box helicase family protein [Oscillospiraceae bacterium]|nr:DEAD/DEAH box helicase family protein [Oscillospiraceae bacterium]